MTPDKKEVIRLLEKIAMYMELKGEHPFKIQAFRKAANVLEIDERSLNEIERLTELPGVGKGIETVINEFVSTGHSTMLEKLQNEIPKELIYLLQIPGLGAKTVAKLYRELGIQTLDELEKACREGKIQSIKGFGTKTERNLLEGIRRFNKNSSRIPISQMLPFAKWIEEQLTGLKGIETFSRAGSLRRLKETLKDLDFVISTKDPKYVQKQIMQFPKLKEIVQAGDTKVTCVFSFDFDVSVDFRIASPDHFPTTLHHFTGSKEHNVRLRQLAKSRNEKISEYGVENIETGKRYTFQNETDFFAHFGLPFIPPELREDGTEIDRIDELPNLVTVEDIKGDLHMHTDWSDGVHSVEAMVEACRRRGYMYVAITDHSPFLKVAHGLTRDRIRKQLELIRNLNNQYSDITILAGIELDILPDGSLDLDEEILKELDIVIASIHSAFDQSEGQIMYRLKSAFENPYVNIIAHPTGRLIGKREGYPVDIVKLFQLAKETNTILELNANPKRFDLKAEYLKYGQEMGVTFVINTDAHSKESLANMEIGVKYARKAWLSKQTVLNTLDLEQLFRFLKQKKNGRTDRK